MTDWQTENRMYLFGWLIPVLANVGLWFGAFVIGAARPFLAGALLLLGSVIFLLGAWVADTIQRHAAR